MIPEIKGTSADEILICCHHCGAGIPKSQAYTCITRNVEKLVAAKAHENERIKVLHSELLLALCTPCAENFTAANMLNLLRVLSVQRRSEEN